MTQAELQAQIAALEAGMAADTEEAVIDYIRLYLSEDTARTEAFFRDLLEWRQAHRGALIAQLYEMKLQELRTQGGGF